VINRQQPETVRNDPNVLQVHSVFNTIQGEGPFVGRPATFIRLAGCNLQCPLCDTDYTSMVWELHVTKILELMDEKPYELIVITGGEPFRQNITRLIHFLLGEGYIVQVETNGTLDPVAIVGRDSRFHIVCSPKEATISYKLIPYISAYKYVIHHKYVNEKNGLPTSVLANTQYENVALPPRAFPRERIYIQPADTGIAGIDAKNLEASIAACKEFGYTLGVQLHKIINLP